MKPPMIVMLGSVKCGKSSLIQMFSEKRFPKSYFPTVEDLYTKVLLCPDSLSRAVEIMDTSGSDEFPVMRELRIKQGEMFIVVYSVDSLSSLENAIRLCNLVHTIKGQNDVPMIIIGNKIDIANREVTSELALEKTKHIKCSHIEVSAKLDVNVQNAFNAVLSLKYLTSEDTVEDVAAARRSGLLRCFSPMKMQNKMPIKRSNTFSGVTQDNFDRRSFRKKRQDSSTVP